MLAPFALHHSNDVCVSLVCVAAASTVGLASACVCVCRCAQLIYIRTLCARHSATAEALCGTYCNTHIQLYVLCIKPVVLLGWLVFPTRRQQRRNASRKISWNKEHERVAMRWKLERACAKIAALVVVVADTQTKARDAFHRCFFAAGSRAKNSSDENIQQYNTTLEYDAITIRKTDVVVDDKCVLNKFHEHSHQH